MKPKPPCEDCGRPFPEHEIVMTGAGLKWACPPPKGSE